MLKYMFQKEYSY